MSFEYCSPPLLQGAIVNPSGQYMSFQPLACSVQLAPVIKLQSQLSSSLLPRRAVTQGSCHASQTPHAICAKLFFRSTIAIDYEVGIVA